MVFATWQKVYANV